MKSIAIIGAGFSGTMVAVQLIKKTLNPVKISLIEKNTPGRGLAYGEIDSDLLLNVRADQMGAFPDRVGHFYEWLQEKKIDCAPSDFISRKIYGDYLVELLASAIKECPSSITVDIVKDEVVDVKADEKKLILKNSVNLFFDELILATGLSTPLDSQFFDIKKSSEPLTIIGSGLSMVDAVVYLKKIHYAGKITVVSRRGKIPLPHQFYDADTKRPNFDFTKMHTLKDVLSVVKISLKEFPWRLVIDALRPHNQFLWGQWSTKERSQFLRYLRPLWDTHRHRLSPQHLKILDELKHSGQLEIKAIGFKPYQPHTKRVINCCGLSLKNDPFIVKLMDKSLVSPDAFFLGIESKKDWLHILGPLLRGQLWETTAVPEIRTQAKNLAELLASAI